jgi:hypothetical protein
MARHAFLPLLLAAGMIPMAAAADPAISPMSAASDQASAAKLDEEYFQRVARDYQKYQHDGQLVYCKKEKPIGSSVAAMRCITEAALRAQVENARRARNLVTPYTG